MTYRRFAKSPMQMRREAEERGKLRRRERKPRPLDPATRPVLDGANFAAYLRARTVEDRQVHEKMEHAP